MRSLLCQREPFLREAVARIVSVTPVAADCCDVQLDDTVLFPQGGGQPDDHGILGGYPVTGVERRGSEVVHRVMAAADKLAVGDSVSLVVDWPRRFHHMQHHSGQHLVTALAERLFGFKTVGWALGKVKATLDLATKAVTPAQMSALEEACNSAIVEDLPVTVALAEEDAEAAAKATTRGLPSDMHGPTRIVTIHGLDANMCCGTHVRHLGTLQCVKLLHTEAIKGTTRVHFAVGQAAVALLGDLLERERLMTTILKRSGEEQAEEAERVVKAHKALQKVVKALLKETAGRVGAELQAGADTLAIVHRDDGDLEFAQTVAAQATAGHADRCVFVTCGVAPDLCYVLVAPDEFGKLAGPLINQGLDGKGGGRGGKLQGKFASAANLSTVASELKALWDKVHAGALS